MPRRLEPSGPCTSALAAAACIGHRASCMGARVRCVEGVVRSLLRMPRGMDVACATDAWHAACCVLRATCRVVRLLRVASTCHVVGCCTLQALCRVAHALRSKQIDPSPSQSTALVLCVPKVPWSMHGTDRGCPGLAQTCLARQCEDLRDPEYRIVPALRVLQACAVPARITGRTSRRPRAGRAAHIAAYLFDSDSAKPR